jgi:hypothetical protein
LIGLPFYFKFVGQLKRKMIPKQYELLSSAFSGQFAPAQGGQFGATKGGQFKAFLGGQGKPTRGGQFQRFLQFPEVAVLLNILKMK